MINFILTLNKFVPIAFDVKESKGYDVHQNAWDKQNDFYTCAKTIFKHIAEKDYPINIPPIVLPSYDWSILRILIEQNTANDK